MAPNSSNDGITSLLNSMSGGGDDCDRPACEDTKAALTDALQRVRRKDDASSSSGSKKNEKQPKSVKDSCVLDAYRA